MSEDTHNKSEGGNGDPNCPSKDICRLVYEGSIPSGLIEAYSNRLRLNIRLECVRLNSADNSKLAVSERELARFRVNNFTIFLNLFYQEFACIVEVLPLDTLKTRDQVKGAVTNVMKDLSRRIVEKQNKGEDTSELILERSRKGDVANMWDLGEPWGVYHSNLN